MAPRDRCRFCNQLDLADNLLDPCACYKKKDSGRTHKHCLEVSPNSTAGHETPLYPALTHRVTAAYLPRPSPAQAYISKWEHEYRANPDRLTARAGLHCSECGKRFRVRLNFRVRTARTDRACWRAGPERRQGLFPVICRGDVGSVAVRSELLICADRGNGSSSPASTRTGVDEAFLDMGQH
jgi:hypothetical protein